MTNIRYGSCSKGGGNTIYVYTYKYKQEKNTIINKNTRRNTDATWQKFAILQIFYYI